MTLYQIEYHLGIKVIYFIKFNILIIYANHILIIYSILKNKQNIESQIYLSFYGYSYWTTKKNIIQNNICHKFIYNIFVIYFNICYIKNKIAFIII